MTVRDASVEFETLTLGYEPEADRLVCRIEWHRGARVLMLTRRLTRRLIAALARRLESAAGDEVTFAHLAAVAEARGGASGRASGTGTRMPDGSVLVTTVRITPGRERLHVTFVDAARQGYRIAMTRAAAHRLLDTLYRKSVAGDWDLDGEVPWLDRASRAAACGGSGLVAH